MSRQHFIYRRIARKSSATTRAAASKQTSSFFDFGGGEESFFSGKLQESAKINRKCEACENEEKKVHKKEDGTSAKTASASTSNQIKSLHGGSALSSSSRAFFEPRFNTDLSEVRIHNDTEAHQLASSVNAKAFAYKNNIVFNKGQFNPEKEEGKKLMAHELSHVVQMKENVQPKGISRAPASPGFDIRGLYPNAAANPTTIFFEMGQSNVPGSELYKIPGIASPPTRNLTLIGTASEEGTAINNTAIIDHRLRAVDNQIATVRPRHTGVLTLTPQPTAGSGNIDYRRVRAVDVIETPGVVPPGGAMPSSTPACTVTPATPHPELESCSTSFTGSHPNAVSWTSKALADLSAGNATAVAQAAILFPGVAIPTLVGHLRNLSVQVTNLPAHHQCHNTCDGGCSRPAYNSGSGSGQMMTLCPDFIASANATEQSETLIHECLHATPGLTTQDTAYSTTRLISTLTGPQALNNTDSFVLLILRINGIAPPAGAALPDTFDASITGADLAKAKQGLSFLEQWLLNAEFDSSLLYTAINNNLGSATGWNTSNNFEAEIAHHISPLVGITDPGLASPFRTSPADGDQVKAAGMFDRYTQLRQKIYLTGLTVNRSAAGHADSWNLSTNTLTLGAAFFALAPEPAVKYLLRLMIVALRTVPATLHSAYVESANEIRKHRSTGP
jgi:hypothetical protein